MRIGYNNPYVPSLCVLGDGKEPALMISDDSFFYLPNLYTFQNKNAFFGSFRGLRFYVKPTEEGEADHKRQMFQCCVWYGEYCLEESEVVAEAVFPLDADGHAQVIQWLDEQYQRMSKPDPKTERSHEP